MLLYFHIPLFQKGKRYFFSFDDYPQAKKEFDKLLTMINTSIVKTITDSVTAMWSIANGKNDAIVERVLGAKIDDVPKAVQRKYFSTNEKALTAFINRKVEGLNLSDRVWKYTDQFKEEIEMALDLGIREGKSAAAMSLDVRKYLQSPDRLFRRVRDEHGLLQLSQRAKAYHPGQGVYRSSYKNARRLTATETNIAYRTADYLRYQQMDFVVGIQICLSNNHTVLLQPGETTSDPEQQRADGSPKANAVRHLVDICDELQGRYPKDFKFTGWHPHCRCHVITILKSKDEIKQDLKRLANGEDVENTSVNEVTELPKNFTEWVKDNEERLKGRATLPYFIKNNFKNGNFADGLKIPTSVVPAVKPIAQIVQTPQGDTKLDVTSQQEQITLFEAITPQEAIDFITANIADGCTLPIKKTDLPMVNQIINQVAERMKQFGIPKFKNVGVCANKKASASWSESNELNFNLSRMNPERIMRTIQAWEKKGIKYTHYEGIDDVVRATIDHELGHRLYGLYRMQSPTITAFGKAAVTRNGFNEMNEVLGYYASIDEQEYFAEAVARWMGRGRKGVVGYTKELMEELMAKVEDRIGVNPIDAMENVHVLSETKLESAINKTRKKLVRQDREKMVVLNSKGAVILETDGVSANVFFDEDVAKKGDKRNHYAQPSFREKSNRYVALWVFAQF